MKKIISVMLFLTCFWGLIGKEEKLTKAVKVIRKPNAEFMTMEIYYDKQGRLIKEILKDANQQIIQKLDFDQYNVKNKPRKAKIYDFNNINKGYFELIYDIEGNLIRVVEKDLYGKLVRTSYLDEEDDVYIEMIADKTDKVIRRKEYGYGEVIQIISDNTEDVVKSKEIIRNGEKYTQEIRYDLSMRPKQEKVYDENNRLLSKYVYEGYYDNGRPKKAAIYDINDLLLGYIEFTYDKLGNVKQAVQTNPESEIIKTSYLQKAHNRYVETLVNPGDELISKTDYYLEKEKIKVVNKNDKEYYENTKEYESIMKRSEEQYARDKKIEAIAPEDIWKNYNLDYYMTIKDKKETDKIKNYTHSSFLREHDEKLKLKIKDIYSKKLKEQIAFSEKNYTIERIHYEDTIVAEIITDSIKGFSEANVVFFAVEDVKYGIELGDITFFDIFNMFDKNDKIYFVELYGSDIKAILANGSKYGEKGHINAAGITWTDKGDGKIANIKIEGKSIIPNKKYFVAVNELIAKRRKFYSAIPSSSQFYRTKYPVFMVVADYLKNLKILDDSYILETRRKREFK